MGELAAGLRLAVSTLTIVPVRVTRADRRAWGVAMASAPLVGLALGGTAIGVLYGARALWGRHGLATLLVAALCVATLAALTRGIHLDGLADTVDGLGCAGDRERRLAVMRDPHVGAFGVVAIVLVVFGQTLALAHAIDIGVGVVALLTGAAAGRLAITWSCTRGVPSARAAGLGAQVAATVSVPLALVSTAVLAIVLGVVADVDGGSEEVARVGGSVLAALVVGWLLRRVATRRLGGITGDVLGATVELGTMAAFLAATIRA